MTAVLYRADDPAAVAATSCPSCGCLARQPSANPRLLECAGCGRYWPGGHPNRAGLLARIDYGAT